MSMTMVVYASVLQMLESCLISFFNSLDAAILISNPQYSLLDMMISFEVIILLYDFFMMITD